MRSEQRSRNAVADQAIGAFQDSLRSPSLRQKLGESLGSLAAIGSRLYIPNIRDGVIQPPKSPKQADGFAVVALHPGDRLFVTKHFTEQSDRQRASTGRQLEQAGLPGSELAATLQEIDSLASLYQGKNPQQLISAIKYDKDVEAETWTAGFALPIDRTIFPGVSSRAAKWSRRGRPMVVLRYTSPKEQLSPTLLLHESVHIEQLESEPLESIFDRSDVQSNNAQRLSMELPAFHKGAMRSRTLLQEGIADDDLSYVDRLHLSIEDARLSVCSSDDPFDNAGVHTQRLIEAFRQIKP